MAHDFVNLSNFFRKIDTRPLDTNAHDELPTTLVPQAQCQ